MALAGSPEQMKETVYRAAGADCYLCSANALTADGKIISTDWCREPEWAAPSLVPAG